MKKGPLGVVNLNIELQDKLLPALVQFTKDYSPYWNRDVYSQKGTPIENTSYKVYGEAKGTTFRVGDRVIQTKNDRAKSWIRYDNYWKAIADQTGQGCGVFNGDVGVIYAYFPKYKDESAKIVVKFDDNRYVDYDLSSDETKVLDLAYAITVHKSQGSEYDNVIVVMPHKLAVMYFEGFACRNLLYTAVTRAKERVVLMGSKDAIERCVLTPAIDRHSTLASRLK
jgi:exodeoxyribonuclease V alpha subunit